DRNVTPRVGGFLTEVGGRLEADVRGNAEDDAVEDAVEAAGVGVAEAERAERLAVAAALGRRDQVDQHNDRDRRDADDQLNPGGHFDPYHRQDQEQEHADEEEQDPKVGTDP